MWLSTTTEGIKLPHPREELPSRARGEEGKIIEFENHLAKCLQRKSCKSARSSGNPK
jgi:hypothetical protein